MSLFLLIGGLLGLLIMAQLLIEGALDIAHRFKISELIIGLTVLTIGTSIPELTVSLVGSFHRLGGEMNSDLMIGNIIGSNIGNIGLILGLAGLIGVLIVSTRFLFIQGVFLIGSIVYFFLISQDGLIGRKEGLIGILLYIIYILILPRYINVVEKKKNKIKYPLWISLVMFAGGLIGVMITADMVVNGGVELAALLNVSQSLVGIFLIGLGTSLPEFVVTITAMFKKSTGLSVGNLIGSNIFNVLVALASSSVIADIRVTRVELSVDFPFLLLLSVIVSLFFYSKGKLEPKESLLILGVYTSYLIYKVLTT